MRILSRLLFLAFSVSFLLVPSAAWASHEMGPLIWWSPGIPGSFPWEFHLEVVYRGTVGVGYQMVETSDCGRVPSTFTLTALGRPEGRAVVMISGGGRP